jgi:hypothetical protein
MMNSYSCCIVCNCYEYIVKNHWYLIRVCLFKIEYSRVIRIERDFIKLDVINLYVGLPTRYILNEALNFVLCVF